MKNEAGMVKSDLTLFSILEGLHELKQGGVTELAEHLDLPKSTVHKHLKAGEHINIVQKRNGKYRLSFMFLKYGGQVRRENRLCKLAQPKVDKLAAHLDEQIAFTIEEYGKGIFVHMQNYQYGLEDEIQIGKRTLLHRNAAGKAILANLPDDRVHNIIADSGLPAATSNTIVDPDRLFDELETIRDLGYAVNHEERHEGVSAIAAPVFEPTEQSLGAMSIAGPTHRFKKDDLIQMYIDELLDIINELKLEIQYD